MSNPVHSNAHRDARRLPLPKVKRTPTGAQRVFKPVDRAFGSMGPNKIAAVQHVESAGTLARLSKGALGDVLAQLGEGASPHIVSALRAVQDGMGMIEATIKNSGGRTTMKGKDTNGVGGGFVARRTNSRTLADLKRQAAASGKVVAKRTSLGELANIMDAPERLGLVECPTAPPPRAASKLAKKQSKRKKKVAVGKHGAGLARGMKPGGKLDTCARRLAAEPWPVPANGIRCTNLEAARLVCELPNVYGMKGTYMQAAKALGFVDKSFAVYYDAAKRYARDPFLVNETRGRPPLASTETLDAAMDAAAKQGGKTSSYDAAMKVLVDSKRRQMGRKNMAGKPTVSKNTVAPPPHTHTHTHAHTRAPPRPASGCRAVQRFRAAL